mgnify:CR=1 FL=1
MPNVLTLETNKYAPLCIIKIINSEIDIIVSIITLIRYFSLSITINIAIPFRLSIHCKCVVAMN